MNTKLLTKYRRISDVLLSVAEETDISWAAMVIESAKSSHSSELAKNLIREAFKKRHQYDNKWNRCKQRVLPVIEAGESPSDGEQPSLL